MEWGVQGVRDPGGGGDSGREEQWGRAVEEVLGPGSERGSCRRAGSDLNQSSRRLLVAAGAPRRGRTCGLKPSLEETRPAWDWRSTSGRLR